MTGDYESETAMRRRQVIEAMRRADHLLILNEDRQAFYHIETAYNLTLSLVLQAERDAMHKEREESENVVDIREPR